MLVFRKAWVIYALTVLAAVGGALWVCVEGHQTTTVHAVRQDAQQGLGLEVEERADPSAERYELGRESVTLVARDPFGGIIPAATATVVDSETVPREEGHRRIRIHAVGWPSEELAVARPDSTIDVVLGQRVTVWGEFRTSQENKAAHLRLHTLEGTYEAVTSSLGMFPAPPSLPVAANLIGTNAVASNRLRIESKERLVVSTNEVGERRLRILGYDPSAVIEVSYRSLEYSMDKFAASVVVHPDDDGVVCVTELPLLPVGVVVRCASLMSKEMVWKPSDELLEVVLMSVEQVAGRVVDTAGAPVSGCFVGRERLARRIREGGVWECNLESVEDTITSRDGTFSVPRATAPVYFFHPEHLPYTLLPEKLHEGVVVCLPRGAHLVGRVVGNTRQADEDDLIVRTRAEFDGGLSTPTREERVHVDGSFRIPGLPLGIHSLEIWQGGNALWRGSVELGDVGSNNVCINLSGTGDLFEVLPSHADVEDMLIVGTGTPHLTVRPRRVGFNRWEMRIPGDMCVRVNVKMAGQATWWPTDSVIEGGTKGTHFVRLPENMLSVRIMGGGWFEGSLEVALYREESMLLAREKVNEQNEVAFAWLPVEQLRMEVTGGARKTLLHSSYVKLGGGEYRVEEITPDCVKVMVRVLPVSGVPVQASIDYYAGSGSRRFRLGAISQEDLGVVAWLPRGVGGWLEARSIDGPSSGACTWWDGQADQVDLVLMPVSRVLLKVVLKDRMGIVERVTLMLYGQNGERRVREWLLSNDYSRPGLPIDLEPGLWRMEVVESSGFQRTSEFEVYAAGSEQDVVLEL